MWHEFWRKTELRTNFAWHQNSSFIYKKKTTMFCPTYIWPGLGCLKLSRLRKFTMKWILNASKVIKKFKKESFSTLGTSINMKKKVCSTWFWYTPRNTRLCNIFQNSNQIDLSDCLNTDWLRFDWRLLIN